MTRLERAIGIVLRVGVMSSSVALGLGLVLSLAGVAVDFASMLLQVGVLVLLCTPVARVIVSVAEYAIDRDWLFLGLTVTVLLELVASAVAALVFNRRL